MPALDGLRGLAVIGVLLFHDGRLRGGYLGVDLFFVLSGYLITSLLLAEHAGAGRIDLRAFWVRRARRLLPAVLALMPGVALYAALFAERSEVARIRWDGLATLGYVANWRSIFSGKSYWELWSAPSPLEHTWSLAIEEQFYVLWPLVVVLVLWAARAGRSRGEAAARALLAVSAGLAIASGAAMLWLFDPDRTSRVYMGTDTRGGSILLGAALSCGLSLWRARSASSGGAPRPCGGDPRNAPPPPPRSAWPVRALDAAGLVALAGLGAAWWGLDGQDAFLYRGGFWLTEAAVLVLIACAAEPRSAVARALSIAPLRWAGLVSYGVYLWHWPVFVTLTRHRTGLAGAPLSALRLAVTVAIALVSYRFLEQPIRRRGITFGRPLVVVPAAIGLAVAALLAGTRALPSPGAPVAAAPGSAAPSAAGSGSAGAVIAPPVVLYNDHIERLPPASELPPGTLRVLVVGDSVAVALGDRLRYMQGAAFASVAVRASGDCSLLDDQLVTKSLNNKKHEGGDCDARWAADVEELRPDVALVILGGGFFAPVQIEGKWRTSCEKEWLAAYRDELARDLVLLGARGARVIVARAPYPVERVASDRWDKATDCFNAMIDEAIARVPGARALPLKEHLCPGTSNASCAIDSRGAPIRPDGMHPVGVGGEDLAAWVLAGLR